MNLLWYWTVVASTQGMKFWHWCLLSMSGPSRWLFSFGSFHSFHRNTHAGLSNCNSHNLSLSLCVSSSSSYANCPFWVLSYPWGISWAKFTLRQLWISFPPNVVHMLPLKTLTNPCPTVNCSLFPVQGFTLYTWASGSCLGFSPAWSDICLWTPHMPDNQGQMLLALHEMFLLLALPYPTLQEGKKKILALQNLLH